MYYVYTLDVISNNYYVPHYVGCTSNANRRLREHQCSSRGHHRHDYNTSPELFDILNKHEWKMRVFMVMDTKEEAIALESELITILTFLGYPIHNKREVEIEMTDNNGNIFKVAPIKQNIKTDLRLKPQQQQMKL